LIILRRMTMITHVLFLAATSSLVVALVTVSHAEGFRVPTAAWVHAVSFLLYAVSGFTLLRRSLGKAHARERSIEALASIYNAVLERLNSGLLVFDADGEVQYANPVVLSVLRRDADSDAVGLHYSLLVDPVLVPVAETIADSMETGKSFSREYRVFIPQRTICVRAGFLMFDDSAGKRFFVLTLEDVTAEDETKRRLSEQLEETRRHSIAKDNFFSNMSHEIRTPINAILGMTYFLKQCELDPRAVSYVQKIENASELLLGVVNDILDFSKMREHKFTLHPDAFKLLDIRKILLDLFFLKAERKGIALSVDFDCPEDYVVVGDQFRLTQVFMNLVANAVKFTVRGRVSVSVNLEELGNDVILRCQVSDTGCGLAEESVARIFADFEQFSEVLNKNHEGTGLGLAICKRLVELMNGVIWVVSRLGKGSSFHFVVVLGVPERKPAEVEPPARATVSRRSGRVLLVEDDEVNAEIAVRLLAELGYEAELALDGVDAVERCRAATPGHYDAVLMDVHMPRMNGYSAARLIKTEPQLDCPGCLVTAAEGEASEMESIHDIIDGSILKPYNPVVFREIFESGATGGK